MSTEDNATKNSSEAIDHESTLSTTEADTSNSGDGAAGPVTLFFILGLAASLVVGWVIFPKLLYSTKEQPIH